MSKRTTTRWYLGAWLVSAIALVVFFMTPHNGYTGSTFDPWSRPISAVAWLTAGIASLVLLVTWIGALIRLGQLKSWGWFVVVFALGIIGMLAYASAGLKDDVVVHRPTVT